MTPVNTPPPVKAATNYNKPQSEEPKPAVRAAEPEDEGWGWGEDALAKEMADVKLPSTASTTTVNKTAATTDEGWSAWGDNQEEEDWDFKPVQRETKIDAKKNKDSLNQKLFTAKRK